MANSVTGKAIRCHGISLVELLVAMVVGLLLLSGITQVYIANLSATQTISGFSSQQENARVALHTLTKSLRLAGHYGGVDGEEITTLGGFLATGVGACDHSWITNTQEPLMGYEGASAASSIADFPAACIDNNHYVPESDVLVVRYASPSGVAPITSLTGSKIYLRTAIASGIDGGEILLGSDASLTVVGSGTDGVGVYNYEYKTEMFFLRPCSELNGTLCDDGVQTLVRMGLDGSTLTAEAIAEGVEQFQIEYGIDTGGDYIADTYNTASSISNWSQVVSARFSLVIRSNQRESGYQDTTTYTLTSGYNYTPGTEVNVYRRKPFTRLVQLRNMSRG